MSMAKRAAGLLVVLVATAAFASPAGAEEPPGIGPLDPGEWVAFGIGAPTLTASRGATTWGPVTVTMVTSPGLDAGEVFAAWGLPVEAPQGWPQQLSSGGVTLTRVSYCANTATQCSYMVSGSSGLWLMAAGTSGSVPEPPDFLLQFQETVTLVPPLPAEIAIAVNQNLNPVKGQNGQPGTITLDASGTTDGDTNPDTLTYAWTVTGNGVTKSAAGKVTTVQLDQDGQYSLTLAVTNPADGHVTTYNGAIAVAGVAPDKPSENPGPPKGGGGGSPAPLPTPPAQGVAPGIVAPGIVAPGVAAEPIVFAPPRRSVPSALFGGQNGEAQVVWLWRPEWAGSPTGPRSPRTSAPPVVRERDDIVVGSSEPTPESNAAPWLAGLAAFGLFGVGWVLTKRRRLRRAEL